MSIKVFFDSGLFIFGAVLILRGVEESMDIKLPWWSYGGIAFLASALI